MKQRWYIFLFLFLIPILSAHAVPHLNGYVNDFAHLMSPSEIQGLNDRITFIEKNTSVEIAIVTVDNTEGDSKDNYAIQIGQENGVGKKANDNGVVILWSVGDQHGGFIATGRGVEDILTDAEVSTMGRKARPLFDQGRTAEGFNVILDGITTKLQPSSTVRIPEGQLSWWTIILIIFFIGLFLFIVAVLSDDDSGGGSFGGSSFIGSGLGGFRGGGGGSFGGGGFGGGGGSF